FAAHIESQLTAGDQFGVISNLTSHDGAIMLKLPTREHSCRWDGIVSSLAVRARDGLARAHAVRTARGHELMLTADETLSVAPSAVCHLAIVHEGVTPSSLLIAPIARVAFGSVQSSLAAASVRSSECRPRQKHDQRCETQ